MSLYNKVQNGEISAMDAYIELYEQQKELTAQLNDIKELARLERERYGKEQIMRKGYLVELSPGRSVWDYKEVSAWVSVKERLSEIEKMAKMAYNGAEVTDKETGEVVEPAKCTYTADTIKLTYKG
jgi:hypothetical protein